MIVAADLVGRGGAGSVESAGGGRGVGRCLSDADEGVSKLGTWDRRCRSTYVLVVMVSVSVEVRVVVVVVDVVTVVLAATVTVEVVEAVDVTVGVGAN